MASANCQQNTFLQIVYWQYVITILNTIVLFAMAVAVYKYIKAHIHTVSEESRSSKSLFCLSLAYYLIVMIYFIDLIINNQYYCRQETISKYAGIVAYYFYGAQSLLLALIFFARLVYIFEGTAYALNQATVFLSVATIIGDCSLFIVLSSVLTFSHRSRVHFVWKAAWVLSTFIGICIVISLNAAFIHRLGMVRDSCKDAASNAHGLRTVITRTAILFFVPTCMTFLTFLAFIVRLAADSLHVALITEVILICDLSANFLCVLLSAKHFGDWYFWLCQHCHQRLVACCNGNTPSKRIEVMSIETDQRQDTENEVQTK